MSSSLATSATPSLHRLSEWFDSAAGTTLLEEQSALVRHSARRFHGDTLLWVGCQSQLLDTVRGCMIRNHFRLCEPGWSAMHEESGIESDTDPEMTGFQAELRALPLPNNSLDAIVVHHALEASIDPRGALRECSRVLTGGGRLVICAFNPFSLWGLRALYARTTDDGFSNLRFVSALRLLDWLAVLGFEVEPVKYLAYNLPLNKSGSQAALWRGTRNLLARYRVPVGGAYVITAVKKAFIMRPDNRVSRVRNAKLAPVAYPKLSHRR